MKEVFPGIYQAKRTAKSKDGTVTSSPGFYCKGFACDPKDPHYSGPYSTLEIAKTANLILRRREKL
jgi:hypothetical protein